jgi:VWFA-related protein
MHEPTAFVTRSTKITKNSKKNTNTGCFLCALVCAVGRLCGVRAEWPSVRPAGRQLARGATIGSLVNSGVFPLAALTLTAVVLSTSTSALLGRADAQRPEQQPSGPPPVSYSIDVSLVEVDAVVTDGEGRVIRDLRKEDFQLFDNGRPQTIDRLSFVEIPIARGDRPAPQPVPTDVASNLHRFDGRLYVVLLDDLHTAALRSGRVKAAARRFVEYALEPGDLAAVVHVSGASGANQDFTTDRALLLASIDRFGGKQLPSQTVNEMDDYNRQLLGSGRTPQSVRDRDDGARAENARSAFDTIAGIARRLAPVRGRRKALLWFGEGSSYDMFDMGRTQASLVRESSRAAIAAASAASVAIYAVDPRGLAGMGDEAVQLTSPSADPTRGLDASGLNREMLRSQTNLRRASNETGGFAVTNTDEFARAFERVVVENSAYYLLGYYPSDTPRDRTFHRLEVRVNRPGARVRARSGYLAAAPAAEPLAGERDSGLPAALRDALASLVPHSGLPMAVHVAAFQGSSSKASALVTVEYGSRSFEPGVTGPDRERLELSVIAVDPAGKVAASDHATISLDVQPETRRAMQVLGFRTHSRLDLPPGRYQVRAAALLRGRNLVGSVYRDVEIPDFSLSRLSMSDLVVTSVVAGYTPTARMDERMREVLPAPPAAARDFRNDEAVALFAEIYEGADGPSGDLYLRTRVRNTAGEVVFEREDVRTPGEMRQAKSGYSAQVALRALPPGAYQLQLEAVSGGDRSRTVVRTTAFHVWEVPAGLPFVLVAKGAISGVTTPGETVARTEAAWDALWRSLALRGTRPTVRFEDTMVVAVFLGTRPTAGYEAEVVGVRRDGDALVVRWREHGPPSPGNPPLPTTPFLLAGVPQHPGVVRFEKVDIPDPDRRE